MYHVSVQPLAERVLDLIHQQQLLRPGDRVGVAVSGGIDSVALLRLLLELRAELGIVVCVVHFNHKLRGAESDTDQEFVAHLAREYDLEFYVESEDVAREAAKEHISVEAAAHELRYGFFRCLLGEARKCDPPGLKSHFKNTPLRGPLGKPGASSKGPLFHGTADGVAGSRALSKQIRILNKIATGHTLDDQAETVLLHLIRGTGLKGLGGIYPRIHVGHDGGAIIRPLLGTRRRELEQYLRDIQQPWREDSTNASTKFTRNRLRHLALPLLEREFNPAVAGNLAELSEIARGEEEYWENEIAGRLGRTAHWSKVDSAEVQRENVSIHKKELLAEPVAVQRRLIRAIGEEAGIPLEFKHIEEILRFASEDAPSGKKLSLPLGWSLKREADVLWFSPPSLHGQKRSCDDYEYGLPVPGRATVPETRTVIKTLRIAPESKPAGYNPEHLFDAELLRGPLRVRNWRPGDRFWPAHTKSPKKIKELLQERHIPQPERKLWPVIANGDEIVWVRGFPVPTRLQAQPGRPAILIQEMPLTERRESQSRGRRRQATS
jgi:tRNA(Ile)-lysidine synthase